MKIEILHNLIQMFTANKTAACTVYQWPRAWAQMCLSWLELNESVSVSTYDKFVK